MRTHSAGSPSTRGRPRLGRSAAACGLAGLAVVLIGSSPAAAASAGLTLVASPNVARSDYNELDGVTAAAGEAWSVGFARAGGPFRALIEHWNGRAWSIVAAAPRPAADDTRLHAVVAAGARDVWAFGSDVNAGVGVRSGHGLIEHWNGSTWSAVPGAVNEPTGAELVAAAAVSPTDIWAVGDANSGAGFTTLIEHWDGAAWHVVPGAPILATGHDFLSGVAAASSHDVWAVGRSFRHPSPIVEHWDGSRWSQVPQPVNGYDSSLDSVSAVSSTDVWAVGTQNLSDTVTEHWDGNRWTLVPSPFPTNQNAQNILTGVVAVNHGDAWAVGSSLFSFSQRQALAEHWDGRTWSLVASAVPSPSQDSLAAIATSGAGQPLWAVGSVSSSAGMGTLVLTGSG